MPSCHQLAFELCALTDGTYTTVVSGGFVAGHGFSPAIVKRVVQSHSDSTRSCWDLSLLCHFDIPVDHSA